MIVNSKETPAHTKPNIENFQPSASSKKTVALAKQSFAKQKNKTIDPRILTELIKNSSAKSLISILATRIEEFDEIHICTFFNSLAKKINHMDDPRSFLENNKDLLQQLCQLAETKVSQMDSIQIANVCWGCCEMHLDAYDLFKAIYEEILSDENLLHQFSPQNIALTLRAYAKNNYRCRPLFNAFAENILSNKNKIYLFNAQSFSIILLAFAELKYFDKKLFDYFANEIINNPDFCEDFKPRNIAMIFKALGEIEYLHRDLFDTFANRITDDPKLRASFMPQEISMALRGCAAAQYVNLALFNAFAEEILTNQDLWERFHPKDISSNLVAYAKLNYSHDKLLDAFADIMINDPDLRSRFHGFTLAVTLRAFANLNYQNQEFFEEIAADIAAKPNMRKKFDPQAISIILNTFGLLKYGGLKIFDAFAQDLMSHSKLRQRFNSHQIAPTLLAFVEINYLHRELFDAFAKDILEYQDLTSFVEEMSNILASYSLIKYENSDLLKKFAEVLLENPHLMQKFNSREIMKILIPYSAANYQHRELFEAFAQIILNNPRLSEQFNSREIAATLRSFVIQNFVHAQLFQLLLDKLQPHDWEFTEKGQLLQVYWYLKKCLKKNLPLVWPEWFLFERKNWQSLIKQQNKVRVSQLQKEVARDLKLINSNFKQEAWIKISVVDVLLSREKLVIEVDGPKHFMENGAYRGQDILKQHILEDMGFRVVRIPYQEWDALKSLKVKKQYLKNVIFNKFQTKIHISEKKKISVKIPEEIKEPEPAAPLAELMALPKKKLRPRHKKIRRVAKKNLKPVQKQQPIVKRKFYTSRMALIFSICAIAFMFFYTDRIFPL